MGDRHMLLEFRAKNFKTYRQELVFSMKPVPKQKELNYSILKEKVGRSTYKALSSAVIYGPNAAGKTNIMGAMDCFKCIVLRGNLHNDEKLASPNVSAYQLELIPNNTLTKSEPVEFAVEFVDDGLHISYSFKADLGNFLQADYPRKVTSEQLIVNNASVFVRENSGQLKIGNLKGIKHDFAPAVCDNLESAKALAEGNLASDELFLMNGFKTIFAPHLVARITDWLKKKFMIVYRADAISAIHRIGQKKDTLYVDRSITDAARQFGVNGNQLGYVIRSEGEEPVLCSEFDNPRKKSARVLSAEIFESYGTIRFINLFPIVAGALVNGGTLVVDEFDASIHPMAIMSLVNIFHNDEINIHHAQLIFNTHNPIFLNSNLYRRDEIKFVERDETTHTSIQYSLGDFGTASPSGVRKGEDYLKNYFVDRYGAIRDVDFSPIFRQIIKGEQAEDQDES